MFHKKLSIFGRLIPVWLVGGALVVAGAGAATGTVLAGQVSGDLGVTVSQSLLVGDSDTRDRSGTAAGFDAVTDDKTAFTSSIELQQGDCYYVGLTLENASDQDLFGDMVLELPEGVTANAVKGLPTSLDTDCEPTGNADDDTTELVRSGPSLWKFNLDSAATDTDDVDISVILAMADSVPPGFYSMSGSFTQTDR